MKHFHSRRKKMRLRTTDERRIEAGWNELRVGSAGVPLALAEELWNLVIVRQRQAMLIYRRLGLSRDVGIRMLALMKENRLPSQQRLVVLSLGYPDRTIEEIAERFGIALDAVAYCRDNANEIRRREPLSSEYWEDIDEDTMTQEEIMDLAYSIRGTICSE
jgi:hypothetical protein